MHKQKKRDLGSCKYCGNPAIIYRRYSGENLCKSCFISKIEKKIYKTISKYDMINPSDKLIVAFSGGKDSLTLLYNLMRIQKQTYNSKELIALTINEGLGTFRDKSIEMASKFCQTYQIKHHIIEAKEYLGMTLNEIVSMKESKNENKNSCNYCALIRRRLLNIGAKELSGDKLAMGHNLTDVAETFLMNILFKRFHKIGNQFFFKNNSDQINQFFIKKIKPLFRIPETEIELYSKLKEFNYYPKLCPYRKSEPLLRKRVLQIINNLKKTSPEIEFNLVNGFLDLSKLLYNNNNQNKSPSTQFCDQCGYPSGEKNICKFCELKIEIEDFKNKD